MPGIALKDVSVPTQAAKLGQKKKYAVSQDEGRERRFYWPLGDFAFERGIVGQPFFSETVPATSSCRQLQAVQSPLRQSPGSSICISAHSVSVLTRLQCPRAKVPRGSYRSVTFIDMGSVLTKYLRDKHGETVKECVGAHVENLRKLQSQPY